MPKSSLSVSLKGADDIFSTEESRQEQQREQVQQIPIGELFPFKDHPFKVLDDESMQRTVESVEQYGVLSPLIARPRPDADCPPEHRCPVYPGPVMGIIGKWFGCSRIHWRPYSGIHRYENFE